MSTSCGRTYPFKFPSIDIRVTTLVRGFHFQLTIFNAILKLKKSKNLPGEFGNSVKPLSTSSTERKDWPFCTRLLRRIGAVQWLPAILAASYVNVLALNVCGCSCLPLQGIMLCLMSAYVIVLCQCLMSEGRSFFPHSSVKICGDF